MAHNGVVALGRQDDWATHDLGAEIGGIYDTAHGATLAMMFPSWLKFVMHHDLDRMVMFAHNVMGVDMHGTREEIALAGIDALKDFYHKVGMPTSFKEAEVPTDRVEEMASKATKNGTTTIGGYVALTKEDVLEIYKMAF